MYYPVVLLSRLINWAYENYKFFSVALALVLWFVGVINDGIIGVVNSFEYIFSTITTQTPNGTSTNFALLEYIGYVNAIIPVSEFISLMAVYLTAWSAVIAIRWLKSFIPTLAN